MNNARREYRRQHETEVRKRAEKLFLRYKNNPLFTAGIMLYWAEGMTSKAARGSLYTLALSNSKYKLLKVFCEFMRHFLNVPEEKIRARLFLYPDLDKNKVKRFWSQNLDIPISQFHKTMILNSRARITKNKLLHGTCGVLVNSKDVRTTVETWIDCFVKNLKF